MTLRLISHPCSLPSASPYRLVDAQNREHDIDPQATYSIVTIDYLYKVGGDRYGILQQGKNMKELGITLRDAIIAYVKSETAAGRDIKPNLDANWIMSPSPPPPPSTIAWECCAVSIVSITLGRFPAAGPTFSVPIPPARLWVTAALTIASLPACDCGSPAAWSFLFPPSRSPLFGKASVPFAISLSWP